MPKYKKIAETLKERILTGVYPLGEALPDQFNLASEFSTSRVTIQKALQLLTVEGLIYSRQGSGTYVRQNALQISKMDSWADEYAGTYKKFAGISEVTSKIIQFDVRFPTEKECEKLLIEKSSPVYDIIRLRLVDGEPYTLEYTIMPIEVIPNLTEAVLHHSIYHYISEDLKLSIGSMNRRIRADKANDYDVTHLHSLAGDPVLLVEQVVFLDNGTPFEYSRTHHRYDKGDIVVINFRNEPA